MTLTHRKKDSKQVIFGLILGILLGIPLGIAATETFPYKSWRWGKDKAAQINDCKRLLPSWVQDRLPKN